jgi:magnesium transporter
MELFELLAGSFAGAHPEEVSRLLEGLGEGDAARVVSHLPPDQSAAVLARLNSSFGARVLARVDPKVAAALLGRLPVRDAAALVLPMEADARAALRGALTEGEARKLDEQMAYAPETAGSMMTPHVLSLSIDLSVQAAISVLRRAPRETVYYLYVTDREGKLAGVLGKHQLLFAGPREPIAGLIQRDVVTVPAHLDREEVARVMDERGFLALPVVDAEHRLLGVVSHGEVLEAVREEAFEDLQKMSGAGGDERALSPLGVVVRKRLPWLGLNLGTAFLGAAVVGLFEGVIAQVTALAVLLPVVSAVSGNAGVQALSVVMRGLALREISPGNRARVLLKEAAVGLSNGVSIAVLAALVAGVWFGSPYLGLVMGLAMLANLVAASILGASIPLVLRALGRDPAQSSSIFLTTLTDIIGFGSFLGLSSALLRFLG